MAAVIHPELRPDPRPGGGRPDLRVVPPPARRRVRVPDRRRAVYHRRRLAVVVVAVVLGAAIWSAAVGGGAPASTRPAASLAVDQPVVAQAGDTYWSVAVRLGGEGDIRERVDALVEANGGAALDVGDRILVPRSLGAAPPR